MTSGRIDPVDIGAGPAGMIAGLRAADLGSRTVLIADGRQLGLELAWRIHQA